MAISPILFNGSVTRMQDVSQIKHNEDMKGMVDQTNFQSTFHKQIDHKMNQVHQSDNTENHQKKFDAKEKGVYRFPFKCSILFSPGTFFVNNICL